MNAPAPGTDKVLRFLLLEDSPLDAELIAEHLPGTGLVYTLDRVSAREEYTQAIDCSAYDLILADYVLPGFDGMSALLLARARCPNTPFIFVSGTLGEEIAIEALKRGATDYVLKQRLERLPATVLRALAESNERTERRRAEDALRSLVDEKTTLLHELDHRVKNNLQLLLSLVNYEIRRSPTREVKQALGRVKDRVQALGIVHRLLYGRDEVATFDMGAFARELAEDLTASSGRSDIRLQVDADSIQVSTDLAAPLALLWNEIISTALSRAYVDRHGKLKLALQRGPDRCLFEIADDHFTREEKDAARDGSSGAIQKALASQLDAQIEWPNDPAVLVRIAIPVPEVAPSEETSSG
jgi:two-component sensor histidine kinase